MLNPQHKFIYRVTWKENELRELNTQQNTQINQITCGVSFPAALSSPSSGAHLQPFYFSTFYLSGQKDTNCFQLRWERRPKIQTSHNSMHHRMVPPQNLTLESY